MNSWELFTSVALYPYYTVHRVGRFVEGKTIYYDSYLVAKIQQVLKIVVPQCILTFPTNTPSINNRAGKIYGKIVRPQTNSQYSCMFVHFICLLPLYKITRDIPRYCASTLLLHHNIRDQVLNHLRTIHCASNIHIIVKGVVVQFTFENSKSVTQCQSQFCLL